MSSRAQLRAAHRLASLLPTMGPWTARALWAGLVPADDAVTAGPAAAAGPAAELPLIAGARLSGLLLTELRTSGHEMATPDRDVLQRDSLWWWSTTATMLHAVLPALQALTAAGIPYVVMKGPGIAAAYEKPADRPFSDVDVVVSPEHFAAATTVLLGLGYVEEQKNWQPQEYFHRWCREGRNLCSPGGGRIDLHHHVSPWLWGAGLDAAYLVSRGQPAVVAGEKVPVLPTELNLLVAALHLVSDRNQPGASLIVWRDVAQLAAAADVDVVVREAVRAGLVGWLLIVLESLPLPARPLPLLEALRAEQPGLPHPRRLAVVLSPGTLRHGSKASQPLRLPAPAAVAFVAGMALPAPSFVRAKFPGSRWAYLDWWNLRRREADEQA